MPITPLTDQKKLRLSLSMGFASLVASLLVAAFTPIAGEALEGALTSESDGERRLALPFCPSRPLGQQVISGDSLGYRLSCRDRQVLEKLADLREAKTSSSVIDSLEVWRVELREPSWFPASVKPRPTKRSVRSLQALQAELERKRVLLQEARALWKTAPTETERKVAQSRVIQLEADCNRLTFKIEDLVRDSELSPLSSGPPSIDLADLAVSADSLLRSALVMATNDGILISSSNRTGGYIESFYELVPQKGYHYVFHSGQEIPDHLTEEKCFLRSGNTLFPVKMLGSEEGPQGSMIRMTSEKELDPGHGWELISMESRSVHSLLRYWVFDLFR